jgi:antitoxin component of RelBE/YafQ-DinJ toxin-antitoxin module
MTLYLCIRNQQQMKTQIIQIRVEPEIKEKLQKMADKDNRKLSDYVRLLILNVIKTK